MTHTMYLLLRHQHEREAPHPPPPSSPSAKLIPYVCFAGSLPSCAGPPAAPLPLAASTPWSLPPHSWPCQSIPRQYRLPQKLPLTAGPECHPQLHEMLEDYVSKLKLRVLIRQLPQSSFVCFLYRCSATHLIVRNRVITSTPSISAGSHRGRCAGGRLAACWSDSATTLHTNSISILSVQAIKHSICRWTAMTRAQMRRCCQSMC